MFHSLSPDLANRLSQLNQKPLVSGELFLLAKAIADVLPLPSSNVDNVALHNLSNKGYILSVVYNLNLFTYLNADDTGKLIDTINRLTAWRLTVAYAPMDVIFTGDSNTIIDELSGLPRVVNSIQMCSVADVLPKANWLYKTFKDLATETKLNDAARV